MPIILTTNKPTPLSVTLVSPIMGNDLDSSNVIITGDWTTLYWDVLRYNTETSNTYPGNLFTASPTSWYDVATGPQPTWGINFSDGGPLYPIPGSGSPCCDPFVTTDQFPAIFEKTGSGRWYEIQLTAVGPTGSASDIGYVKYTGA